MLLPHTWLDGFCGWILIPSQGRGVFWEILILCSRRMTVKGWLLIRFPVMNFLMGLILMIFLVCLFTGSCYTWCNGRRGLHRIHRRLNWALCN